MHYRKKSPKDETKEKEKLLRTQKFHAALTKFLNLKKSGCKDRNLLKDIGNLLRISPEFNTLWNYRKEIFIDFKRSIDDLNETEKRKLIEEFDKMCLNELALIENCLISNPKAYSVWHHRIWLIKFMNNPDLKKEIQLCNQCLSLDERNFHCWNYRQFIVKFGNMSTIDELRFTSKKITANFSNFSSWHYRSCLYKKLLAENYDQNELKSMINKDFLTVKNAIFTDPNDQSPWLYLKWLLEFENLLNIPKELNYIIERYLWAKNFDDNYLFAIEFKNSYETLPTLDLKINDQSVILKKCKSIFNGTIWLFNADFQMNPNQNHYEFTLMFENEKIDQTFTCDTIDSNSNICFIYMKNHIMKESSNSTERIEDLKILLYIEDSSKWPNYMLTLLDSVNYSSANIDALIKMDPLRTNYYNDLKSKMILKQKLSSELTTNRYYNLINFTLHSLYYMSNWMHLQYLNLSENHLIKVGLSLSPLINLRCLILDHNQIYLCDKNLRLDNLVILSLKNNRINDFDELNALCNISFNLRHINLIGNPLKSLQQIATTAYGNIRIYLDLKDEQEFLSFVDTELKQIEKNKAIWALSMIQQNENH